MMCSEEHQEMDQSQQGQYEIRLNGHLDSRWTEWFDGFSITWDEDQNSVLTGFVTDQAALHGLLKKIRDLGVTLISINRISNQESSDMKIGDK